MGEASTIPTLKICKTNSAWIMEFYPCRHDSSVTVTLDYCPNNFTKLELTRKLFNFHFSFLRGEQCFTSLPCPYANKSIIAFTKIKKSAIQHFFFFYIVQILSLCNLHLFFHVGPFILKEQIFRYSHENLCIQITKSYKGNRFIKKNSTV